MANLMDLPAELIIGISSYLTTPELGLMRSCCKRIEQTLFDDFAKEFFTKRQFMIEHDSLNTLVAIANHPKLSARLTEVLISTHYRTFEDMLSEPEAARRLETKQASRVVLIATGMAHALMRDAFSKLSNLKTVGIRDFDGSGRTRDGPLALWRSWGWSTGPSEYLEMERDASAVFALVVSALGEANAHATKIEVILRRALGLRSDAFFVSAQNAPVLARLKSVMLEIAPCPPYWNDSAQELYDQPLRRFLTAIPDLVTLRLNERHGHAGRVNTRRENVGRDLTPLLEWLGKPLLSTTTSDSLLVPPVYFAKLKRLDIGMTLIQTSALLAVLAKFDLASFSLWKIGVQCAAPEVGANPEGWFALFKALAGALQNSSIRSATIGQIYQRSTPSQRKHMTLFLPQGIDTEEVPKLIEAQLHKEVKFQAKYGLCVSQWLNELADRLWDPTMRRVATRSSTSDSEMNDGEGEGQDEAEEDSD